ncbi:MAG TPA: hypothetical protein VIM31_01100 [Candidatus Microsaccharimonas sp.]|jgi:hypothetical protein
MSTEEHRNLKSSGPYKIVGRDSRIDISQYMVTVHGREVIDYEKLEREKPRLYKEILEDEKAQDLLDDDI